MIQWLKTKEFLFLKAIALSIPMLLISFVIITYLDFSNTIDTIAKLSFYFLINLFFFLSLYTKKIDRYRSILFILIAISFTFSFITNLYHLRGHFMTLTFEEINSCEVPFCHIAIPQTLLSVILKREVIFPGAFTGFQYTISVMFVIWIVVSLSLGRGWCSWVCFYGGWEDGCSRICKKPRITKIPEKLKYFPYAFLIAIMLFSTATMVPQYCVWFCPFKSVSEFFEVTRPTIVLQTMIFIVLFISLVVVLPILTKKRIQCTYLCPFGAMQSFTNKISPFQVSIDLDQCVECKVCMKACPTNSISEESLKLGKVTMTCVKCGKCIDQCPKKAINYTIRGTRIGNFLSQYLFLLIAYIVMAGFGGTFVFSTIRKILHLIIYGSLF